MRKLIDAYETIQEIVNNKTSFIGTHDEVESHDKMCDYAVDYIQSATAVDAEPVIHASWVEGKEDKPWEYVFCSNCRSHKVPCAKEIVDASWKYCPYCGAKMDKEV